MRIALILIGIICIPAFVFALGAYVLFRMFPAPAADSNEALRNWLLSNPGKTIDDYLEGK